MSGLQRKLLLATLTLVAAGLAGLGAGLFGGGIDETRSVARERDAVSEASPIPREPENAPTASPPRSDVAASTHGSLEVRVVDARGAPLPEAAIRATGPDGDGALEARGRVLWAELEPGPWQLEVTHPDYRPQRLVFGVSDSDTKHILIDLSIDRISRRTRVK